MEDQLALFIRWRIPFSSFLGVVETTCRTPDETEQVQAHVQLCGSCQVAIEMLERFEQCLAGELPEPPDWPKVERRSRKRFYAFLESQKPSPPGPSFWETLRGVFSWETLKIVFSPPGLAYLLVLALAYPAYLGLFRKPEVVREVIKEPQIVEVEKAALRTVKAGSFRCGHDG
jgi:hypothetical protein